MFGKSTVEAVRHAAKAHEDAAAEARVALADLRDLAELVGILAAVALTVAAAAVVITVVKDG